MPVPALAVQIEGQGAVTADNVNTFVQTCDTFAELRGFIGLQSMEVSVKGGEAIADGLQGTFYWNSTSTASDDNDSVIAPTGGPAQGRWLRIPTVPIYTVAFELMGGSPPLASEICGMHCFATAVQFAPNWGQHATPPMAAGQCLTNPAATFVLTAYKVSGGVTTQVGTLTISTGGAFIFATTGQAVINFAFDDLLYWQAQSIPDVSLANFAWTVVGVPQ